MANAAFPINKKALLDGNIDFLGDDIRVMMVTSGYTYDAGDEFVADIGANILTNGRSPALASKTTTGGVFDAADPTLPTVNSGQTADALILFQHTGSDATARVILFLDTGVTGLPFSTTGGDVSITFDNGANKILALLG